METLQSQILTRLSFEMSAYEVVQDILSILKLKEDRDTLLLSLLLDCDAGPADPDDVDVILMTTLGQIDEESLLMAKVVELFSAFIDAPDSIIRPYQQHFITVNGANRVNVGNFRVKFNGLAEAYFRFNEDQVFRLIQVLEMPTHLVFNGYKTTSLEALCISLHKLSSQCRFIDLTLIYDLLPQFMSQVHAGCMVYIYRKFGDVVRSFEHSWSTDRPRLEDYASRISDKGCPLANTVAFVDGSHVPVARPSRGQRSWFCGHHKTHCFKTLVIQYPNGMVTSFGPYDGTCHDSSAAQMVELDEMVRRNYTFPDVAFQLFGDSGYGISPSILTPFRRGPAQTQEEADWNRLMSRYRITVEWGIGRVKTLWKSITNKGNMKALLSPVSIYWFNAVLLTNIHCCLNGSQISDFFECDPPTVEEYLNL